MSETLAAPIAKVVRKVTASVDPVSLAEIFESFLAVEENKLNLFCQARLLS